MANYDAKDLAVFNTVCSALDSENLKYDADKEKLTVFLKVRGEDLPISVLFRVGADRNVLSVNSLLDATAGEDKRVEFAIAINAANYALVNGSFDYDINSGKIIYRMAHPYLSSDISESIIKYMLYCLFSVVDEYNDRFVLLSQGVIDIAKFIELANS
jgi:hypothetical protein